MYRNMQSTNKDVLCRDDTTIPMNAHQHTHHIMQQHTPMHASIVITKHTTLTLCCFFCCVASPFSSPINRLFPPPPPPPSPPPSLLYRPPFSPPPFLAHAVFRPTLYTTLTHYNSVISIVS